MRVRVVWLMCGLVAAVTAVTYWRLPPGATYHFDDTGFSGAASRLISYLNFPVALIAIALVAAVARGTLLWVGISLCAVVGIPGVGRPGGPSPRLAYVPRVNGLGAGFWLALGA